MKLLKVMIVFLLLLVFFGAVVSWLEVRRGFSARAEPSGASNGETGNLL